MWISLSPEVPFIKALREFFPLYPHYPQWSGGVTRSAPCPKIMDKMTISVHVCLCYTALIKLCYFAVGIAYAAAAMIIFNTAVQGLFSVLIRLGEFEEAAGSISLPVTREV